MLKHAFLEIKSSGQIIKRTEKSLIEGFLHNLDCHITSYQI